MSDAIMIDTSQFLSNKRFHHRSQYLVDIGLCNKVSAATAQVGNLMVLPYAPYEVVGRTQGEVAALEVDRSVPVHADTFGLHLGEGREESTEEHQVRPVLYRVARKNTSVLVLKLFSDDPQYSFDTTLNLIFSSASPEQNVYLLTQWAPRHELFGNAYQREVLFGGEAAFKIVWAPPPEGPSSVMTQAATALQTLRTTNPNIVDVPYSRLVKGTTTFVAVDALHAAGFLAVDAASEDAVPSVRSSRGLGCHVDVATVIHTTVSGCTVRVIIGSTPMYISFHKPYTNCESYSDGHTVPVIHEDVGAPEAEMDMGADEHEHAKYTNPPLRMDLCTDTDSTCSSNSSSSSSSSCSSIISSSGSSSSGSSCSGRISSRRSSVHEGEGRWRREKEIEVEEHGQCWLSIEGAVAPSAIVTALQAAFPQLEVRLEAGAVPLAITQRRTRTDQQQQQQQMLPVRLRIPQPANVLPFGTEGTKEEGEEGRGHMNTMDSPSSVSFCTKSQGEAKSHDTKSNQSIPSASSTTAPSLTMVKALRANGHVSTSVAANQVKNQQRKKMDKKAAAEKLLQAIKGNQGPTKEMKKKGVEGDDGYQLGDNFFSALLDSTTRAVLKAPTGAPTVNTSRHITAPRQKGVPAETLRLGAHVVGGVFASREHVYAIPVIPYLLHTCSLESFHTARTNFYQNPINHNFRLEMGKSSQLVFAGYKDAKCFIDNRSKSAPRKQGTSRHHQDVTRRAISEIVIDLHCLPCNAAKQLVRSTINFFCSSGAELVYKGIGDGLGIKDRVSLVFICGRGTHSIQGGLKLVEEIPNFLRRNNVRCEDALDPQTGFMHGVRVTCQRSSLADDVVAQEFVDPCNTQSSSCEEKEVPTSGSSSDKADPIFEYTGNSSGSGNGSGGDKKALMIHRNLIKNWTMYLQSSRDIIKAHRSDPMSVDIDALYSETVAEEFECIEKFGSFRRLAQDMNGGSRVRKVFKEYEEVLNGFGKATKEQCAAMLLSQAAVKILPPTATTTAAVPHAGGDGSGGGVSPLVPPGSPESPHAGVQWTCPSCTLVNNGMFLQCSACTTERPAET